MENSENPVVNSENPEFLARLADQFQAGGKSNHAEATYRRALAVNPDLISALFGLGELLAQAGRPAEAVDYYARVAEQAPDLPELRVRLASAHLDAGELEKAEACLIDVLDKVSGKEIVLCLLGDVLDEAGKAAESERRYREAAELKPEWADPWHRIGLLAEKYGTSDEAIAAFEKALELDPTHSGALRDRGLVLLDAGMTDDGMASLASANLKPADWLVVVTKADSMCRKKRFAEAFQAFQIAQEIDPKKFESRLGIFLCAQHMGRVEEALSGFLEIEADFPDRTEIHNAIGSLYYSQGRNAEAKRAHERALEIDPRDSDTLLRLSGVAIHLNAIQVALTLAEQALKLDHEPSFANRTLAIALSNNERHSEALAAANRAVEVSEPGDVSALLGLAAIYEAVKDRPNALKAYRKVVEIDPNQDSALARIVDLQLTICDWAEYDTFISELLDRIEGAISASEPLHMVVQDLHNIPISPELMAAAAHRRGQMAEEKSAEARRRLNLNFDDRLARWREGERWPLRVGYALPYTRFQSFTMLLHGVTSEHDRQSIETFGYSVEPSKGSEFESEFRDSFDHFRDLPHNAPETAGKIVSGDEIDVLIDVTGHTSVNCQNILATRPAPVRAQMFGFSFTCGGEYMDYLLTDHAWMPKRLANLCIEDLVYLPDSMMIGNRMPVSDRTFARADMGLPDDGFVLCNFNQPFKIEPSIFSVWMNMLRRIPDSVLWLGGWDETAVQNLRREAEARGVAGQRLIFADVLSHPEHLSRLSLADLAVDNRYHGGGATSIDALWAGVPLLTCQGETPASGNGKSLALAIGVGEMVVDSMAEYEETGVALARDSQRYQALRRKVENNRHGSALFNPALYARHLEMAIELMWERTVAGMSGDIEVPRYAGGALSD